VSVDCELVDRHAWLRPGIELVAPDVYRIPCPLPQDGLRAVNVYALVDDGQITLIDSGWAHPDTVQALENGIAQLGATLADVALVLCTHGHYDHYGFAPELRTRHGAGVALGREEVETLVIGFARDRYLEWADARHAMLVRHGAGELADIIDRSASDEFDSLRTYGIGEPPDRLIDDGDAIRLSGGRVLRARVTPGHTKGHLTFHDEEHRLLFAGDHVLPHITPSLGFEPFDDGRALARFLPALRAMQHVDASLVLPGHGPTFRDLDRRVRELLEHHRNRLSRCLDIVSTRGVSTTYDVAAQLTWTRHETPYERLSTFSGMLAVTETGTHLELLAERGFVQRADEAKVTYWEAP
jgi:glyoxylase-like metal-dependent hydrolase (beta-lactamase superfamily II)